MYTNNNPNYNVCPNCGARIRCSCKRRIAKDGTRCCQACVTSLNQMIDKRLQESQNSHTKK